jgi:ArsR family metal-binding transcriptional regulator
MFLELITLAQTNPCLAEPGKIIVTGKPSLPLDDVLPYLATLPGVIGFNPETLALTLRRQPGFITIYRQRITITQVKDVAEGLSLLEAPKEAINVTWEHRHELVPVTESQRPPRLLDVYAILPQTNCKQCGEATCRLSLSVCLWARRPLSASCPCKTTRPTLNVSQLWKVCFNLVYQGLPFLAGEGFESKNSKPYYANGRSTLFPRNQPTFKRVAHQSSAGTEP